MKIADIMSRDPITVAATEPLYQALATMDELDVRHLPVLRNGRLAGVISDRDLLESTGWMWNEERGRAPVNIEDVLRPEPMTVAPDDSVAELARRLVEWGVGCAPVVVEGELRGIATEIDVLKAFAAAHGAGRLRGANPAVEELMTTDVITLEVASTAVEALEVMRDANVRHLPVVEEQKVMGIVSDRDLRAQLGRALPGETAVREFMSTEVQTAAPEDDLASAARRMAELKIGGLPVVERDDLVGMITMTDVLAHCARALA